MHTKMSDFDICWRLIINHCYKWKDNSISEKTEWSLYLIGTNTGLNSLGSPSCLLSAFASSAESFVWQRRPVLLDLEAHCQPIILIIFHNNNGSTLHAFVKMPRLTVTTHPQFTPLYPCHHMASFDQSRQTVGAYFSSNSVLIFWIK